MLIVCCCRSWSDCAQVAAVAAARLSRCPEPQTDVPAAATLSLRCELVLSVLCCNPGAFVLHTRFQPMGLESLHPDCVADGWLASTDCGEVAIFVGHSDDSPM